MIYGVGVDIVEIARIRKALLNPRFEARIFTPAEIAYCRQRAHPYPSFAARFAAKEALYKALFPLVPAAGWLNAEVITSESGRPSIILSGEAALSARQAGIGIIHLTLSHSRELAEAVVVAEYDR